jgi:predicted esterase
MRHASRAALFAALLALFACDDSQDDVDTGIFPVMPPVWGNDAGVLPVGPGNGVVDSGGGVLVPDPGTTGAGDAAVRFDAGGIAPSDAAVRADAGAVTTLEAGVDAAVRSDAGVVTSDAATMVDASAALDGGQTRADAAVSNDASAASDAARDATLDAANPPPSGPAPTIPQPSATCPVFQSGTMRIHGLSVEVYAGPRAAGKKGPLVFYWHGTGGSGKDVETSPFGGSDGAGLPSQVRSEILAAGGIIISPTDDDSVREGEDVTFLLGVWYTPGDLQLADLVAACAVEQYDIDPRRIYTSGCSAGGLMAGVMAFHRSSYLAASAPNSGGVVASIPGMTTFQDSHTPALMTMHGDRNQDEVFVNFEDTSADADKAVAARGGFVINCNHGGGHCGAPTALKLAMWQFMKDHPFGVSPEPYANGLPAVFPSYCKVVK